MQFCRIERGEAKVNQTLLMAIAFVIGVLVLVLAFSGGSASIQNMPVYVKVPTNPSPQLAAALGVNTNWFVSIPYAQAVNKLVNESELKKIKQAIPRFKTVGRLFSPRALVIDSPTEVSVEFWRRRTPIWMTMIKTGEIWQVEHLGRGGQIHWTTPPGFLDKLEKKMPF